LPQDQPNVGVVGAQIIALVLKTTPASVAIRTGMGKTRAPY